MTILTIDVGSSSVRALLFDDQSNLIEDSVISRKYSFDLTNDGGSTVEATFLRDLVEQCIDDVLKHPLALKIRAVGIDTFVGNVLGIDHHNNPLTPIFTYADTRSAEDVHILSTTIDKDNNLQRTGCPLHTAYHPARLHWLRRNQPEIFANVACWVDFASYLYTAWFGQSTCSFSVASWSGLLNRQSLTWDKKWLHLLGLTPSKFPPLVDFSDTVSALLPALSSRWPILQSVPFFLALGDGAAANIGMGATKSSTLAITVGTTAALRLVYPTSDLVPQVPDGLWSYRIDKAHHLIGGATSEGGNIFQWLQSTFPSLDFDHEQNEIMNRPADSHGLTCLPLFNGERSPGWNSNAAGTIHGLRLSTTPTDIFQAALEAVALRIALIADQLPSIAETIYISGGAVQASHLWAQIICNALNNPVHLIQELEPTAHGVALLIASVLNATPFTDYNPTIAGLSFVPQPDNVLSLHEASKRQQNLYHQLYSKPLL